VKSEEEEVSIYLVRNFSFHIELMHSGVFLRTVFKLNSLNKCSVVAEKGDRLVAIDMGRNEGGCCVFFWENRRRSEAETTAGHKH